MTRMIPLVLVFQAATYAAAALIHFGIIMSGYEHEKAGIAETIIAAALFAGAAYAWFRPSSSRPAALTAQAFALLLTLVGIFTIIVGVGPRTVPDIVYHAAIVLILLAGLALAARAPTDRGRSTS
jgi:hypothetical protein